MNKRLFLKYLRHLYLLVRIIIPFKETQILTPSGRKIQVRVLSDRFGHALGLSFSKKIPQEGMLFVYDKLGQYFFHMMDMNYAIDMVFLNARTEVVFIAYNQMPSISSYPRPAVTSPIPAQYVLEIPALSASEYGMMIGSRLAIELL